MKKFNYMTYESVTAKSNCNGRTKTRYSNPEQADEVVNSLFAVEGTMAFKYKCSVCKGWHLTSDDRDLSHLPHSS